MTLLLIKLRAIGQWLKTYWYWLLVPVGLALLWLRRRTPDVVAPELVGADAVHEKMNEAAERQVEEAAVDRDQKLEELQQEHTAAISELSAEQQQKAEELKADPAALNEFLLDVSKQMRH